MSEVDDLIQFVLMDRSKRYLAFSLLQFQIRCFKFVQTTEAILVATNFVAMLRMLVFSPGTHACYCNVFRFLLAEICDGKCSIETLLYTATQSNLVKFFHQKGKQTVGISICRHFAAILLSQKCCRFNSFARVNFLPRYKYFAPRQFAILKTVGALDVLRWKFTDLHDIIT